VLSDEDVIPERDVVLEERRMRTDSNPSEQLSETLWATLYVNHPYGQPIIGWKHEIEGLDRSAALSYYNRFYTPENAILVVAGDVTPDGVLAAANDTYGSIPARGEAPQRTRKAEPPLPAARRVELADPKVEQPTFQRYWLVPSHQTDKSGAAHALDVLAQLLGGGPSSRLFRALVQEQEIATNAGCWYMGDSVDLTRLAIYAVPRDGVDLKTLEKATERVIADIAKGIEPRELARAKTQLVADAIYARDSQATMARIYGATLAIGGAIEDVDTWPEKIDAVTAEDVIAAVQRLSPRVAVTGYLLKEDAA
jgi:zinc protease